jgi:hypothetical protein
LAAFAAALLTPRPGVAESWTSLDGSSTVEAKMIGLWNDSVVLQLVDGRRVTVSLANLKAESRIQAKNLAKVKDDHLVSIVKELRSQADAASAPAPNPIPKPPAPPAYVQPKAGATVVEQLILVDEQSRDGHILAAFDALPPSYQNDISELVKQAAAKIDAASWQSLIGSIHSIGEVIVTKQRWVFSHPRLQAMPVETSDQLEDITLLVAGLIRDGLDPQAMDITQLQTMPLRAWLAERDRAMAPYIAALNDLAGGLNRQTFELASEKDGTATVTVTMGDVSSQVAYTNVEGFWVPKSLADGWAQMITDARTKLQETPDGSLLADPMTAMIPTMIQPVVGPLAAANDEQGFHAAMETMLAQMAPAVTSVANLAGMDLNRGRSGRRGGGGDGMGSEYMEMEMEMQMDMEDMQEDMDMDMEMEMEMNMGGYPGSGPAPGTGGSSDANPNIGARLEGS